jgi:hypothetical protein
MDLVEKFSTLTIHNSLTNIRLCFT